MSSGAATIQTSCPQCGKQLGVPAQHAGKQGRCPACKSVFTIPAAAAAAAVAPQNTYQSAPAYQAAPTYQAQPAPQYPQQPVWQAPSQPVANYQAPNYPAANYQASPQTSWSPPAPAMPAAGMAGIPNPFGNAPGTGGWNAAPAQSPFGQPFAQQPVAMNNLQPLYQGQQPPPAAAQSTNPFGDQDGGDLRLAPVDPSPAMHSLTPAYNAYSAPALPKPDAYSGAFESEKRGMDAGVWGGVGLMLLAVGWFVGGLMFGIIFFYPPVLFIIGIVAVVRGLFNR